MEIKKAVTNTAKLAYSVFGNGKIDTVIEMGLCAVMAEWEPIAKQLASHHTVMLYERAGYGGSGASALERTPQNIALELHSLLEQVDHEEKITVVAHSQGGLYAQQFARMYPHMVENLILLDPLSPYDNDFKYKLTKSEYKKSGADKSGGMKFNLMLSRLRLGSVISSIMRTAPPFYYYDRFTQEQINYILDALTKPILYKTALQEYKIAHDESILRNLKTADGFPAISIILVTHSSEREIKEICEFGGASEKEAEKIETLWQDIMKKYLLFSSKSKYICAENSSHYIHLTDMELLCDLINNL